MSGSVNPWSLRWYSIDRNDEGDDDLALRLNPAGSVTNMVARECSGMFVHGVNYSGEDVCQSVVKFSRSRFLGGSLTQGGTSCHVLTILTGISAFTAEESYA
jgi:hypothetical protein